MRFSADRLGGLLLLTFCCGYALLIGDIASLPGANASSFGARSMPTFLAALAIPLCLWLIIKPGPTSHQSGPLNWRLGGITVALMLAYGATIRPAGFIASTTVFLWISFCVLGSRRWLAAGAIACAIAALFWLLMSQALGIYVAPWPQGSGS